MQKQAILLVFCGFVASTMGQNFGNKQFSQTNLGAQQLDGSSLASGNGPSFLGASDISASSDLSALGSVRSIATDQVTSIDCQHQNKNLDQFGCEQNNDWNCECNEGLVQVPRAIYSRTVVEALTSQTIPLQSVATNTTETTDRCYQNNQEAERNVQKRAAFSSNGTLESHTYDVAQSCFTEQENFCNSGCGEWDFSQGSEDIGADCECHPISSGNRGRIDTDCDCDCEASCLQARKERSKKEALDNPDRDIENRVSSQVEKAIADILSEVVNRCITSSFQKCINWEE